MVRAARRGTARAPHGELPAAAAQPRGAVHGRRARRADQRHLAARAGDRGAPRQSARAIDQRRAGAARRARLRRAPALPERRGGAETPAARRPQPTGRAGAFSSIPRPSCAARGIKVDRVRAPLREVGRHRRRGAEDRRRGGAIRFEFTGRGRQRSASSSISGPRTASPPTPHRRDAGHRRAAARAAPRPVALRRSSPRRTSSASTSPGSTS